LMEQSFASLTVKPLTFLITPSGSILVSSSKAGLGARTFIVIEFQDLAIKFLNTVPIGMNTWLPGLKLHKNQLPGSVKTPTTWKLTPPILIVLSRASPRGKRFFAISLPITATLRELLLSISE